jgi:hypothetical protein
MNITEQPLVKVCTVCGGLGFLPYYSHVDEGVCFECDGSGTIQGESSRGPFVTQRHNKAWPNPLALLDWSDGTSQLIRDDDTGITALKTFSDQTEAFKVFDAIDEELDLVCKYERGDYEFRVRADGTVQVNLLLQDDDFLIYGVMSLADARLFWKSL